MDTFFLRSLMTYGICCFYAFGLPTLYFWNTYFMFHQWKIDKFPRDYLLRYAWVLSSILVSEDFQCKKLLTSTNLCRSRLTTSPADETRSDFATAGRFPAGSFFLSLSASSKLSASVLCSPAVVRDY